MASLREYFDNDFSYAARIYVKLQDADCADVEAGILYDFSAYSCFVTCYVPQFFGDPEWISTNHISQSKRIFIYSETQLNEADILLLKERGREQNQQVQFRSKIHAERRSTLETPIAFISHDSRDKAVAHKIALGLQRLLCPVWYDEFSLKVGDNLRESIEKGLKSCRKCVVILSQSFFSNSGWTRTEFDAIFTREIMDRQNLVLPVWLGVTKNDVYEYCPNLVNVMGLNWELGEEEVCRKLGEVVLGQSTT
jgi:TIR domain